MILPNIEEFMKALKKHNVIPVSKTIRADFETPISIFLKLKADFLLESVESGSNVGRYSIIAFGKRSEIILQNRTISINEYYDGVLQKGERCELRNPLEKIREYFNSFNVYKYEDLPHFFGGAIGYLGYEAVQYFEDIPVIKDSEFPDGILIIPEAVLIFDVVKRTILAVVSVFAGKDADREYNNAINKLEIISQLLEKPLDVQEEKYEEEDIEISYKTKKEYFLECVNKCKEYIKNGDVIQCVYSQPFEIRTGSNPFDLYRTLRMMNPSPYLFFLDFKDFQIIGSSPEVMVRLQNNEILLKPIAGTAKRGKNISEDNRIAKELLEDPKERAEHIMLVDLGRNDLGRIALPGTVEVADYMSIEKYSHVMHIVSTIKAFLDEKFDVFDVIKATFPAGTLSGAPKIRAMQIIAELEKYRRGPYGGMIFNMCFNGNFDSCITIRTILLKDGIAHIQAGAGIVADSIPENEYNETINKSMALVKAIEQTQKGEKI